jgi:A/G-specific adenine glycosylase
MTPSLTGRGLKTFQARMLAWFRAHQRDLPWRRSRDPYRIWVAEVMLQQTRITAVMPYYQNFLARFPTVQMLARASEPEVLKLWSGLGYYSRARNLHRAAKIIVTQHKGQFPRDLDAALELPGIGVYTAAAVLSIAYDVPLAVLDGNVARVLARIKAIRGDLRAPKNWRALTAAAQSFFAAQAAGDWNESLMELGEVICTPRSPHCAECPVARDCRAYAQGLTDEIPAPRRKRAAVHMKIAAAILRDPRGRTLLVQDPGAHDTVLFSRMWQFPAVEVTDSPKAQLEAHLSKTLSITKISLKALPTARHGVTFRNLTLLPFLAKVRELPKLPRTRILALKNLANLPISSATRKIATSALKSASNVSGRRLAGFHALMSPAGVPTP